MAAHELFDEWTTYGKVVEHDYMHHRAYFEALVGYLTTKLSVPVSILDLGCGDALPVLPLLGAFEIARYVGVDESAEALARARCVLEASDIQAELLGTSMQQASPAGRFDLIVASYSLHHLQRPGKRQMLEWCLARLKSGGILAVIDVFMEPGELRDQYLDRWETNARSSWSALSLPEVARLVDHVRASDFPEPFSAYRQMAYATGFSVIRELMQGPDRLNKLIVLEAGNNDHD